MENEIQIHSISDKDTGLEEENPVLLAELTAVMRALNDQYGQDLVGERRVTVNHTTWIIVSHKDEHGEITSYVSPLTN